ncbi:hypothetical protein AAFH68_11120 [Flavobacterium sp. CGRL1]|jgi:hypothetical protein
MKQIFIIFIILFSFSCTRKTEFIQSKVYSNLFLIKNPPKEDSLLKKEITFFLIKNPPKIGKRFTHLDFYKYSWNTKYFLDNEEDSGGFSSEELSYYPEDNLGTFIITKCKNDTTKLVGELFTKSPFKADTIIYKCD